MSRWWLAGRGSSPWNFTRVLRLLPAKKECIKTQLNRELSTWLFCVKSLRFIPVRPTSRENEIKKAEGQSVINAVKVFDKSYSLEAHCNTLGKMIFPYLDKSNSKPNTLQKMWYCYTTHRTIFLLWLPMWPIMLVGNPMWCTCIMFGSCSDYSTLISRMSGKSQQTT